MQIAGTNPATNQPIIIQTPQLHAPTLIQTPTTANVYLNAAQLQQMQNGAQQGHQPNE
jgi:hypothetical protein